jgi:uncharacterized phage protein (TIGR01671 family)
MRKVKFRIWEALSKEMIYDAPSIVMQYAGIKDKYGKDIYEGDIVRWERGCTPITDRAVYFSAGVIKFELLGWMFSELDGSSFCSLSAIKPSELEVLGNIYENPELI